MSPSSSRRLFTRSLLREIFWSWDCGIAILAGTGSTVLLLLREVSVPRVTNVLLAMVALAMAVIALALTVMAILFAFTDREYHDLLERTTLGFMGALRPFMIVACIAAFAAAVGLAAALTWTEVVTGGKVALLGLTSGLTAWALAGTVQLIGLLIWHAKKKAEWYGIYRKAQELIEQVSKADNA